MLGFRKIIAENSEEEKKTNAMRRLKTVNRLLKKDNEIPLDIHYTYICQRFVCRPYPKGLDVWTKWCAIMASLQTLLTHRNEFCLASECESLCFMNKLVCQIFCLDKFFVLFCSKQSKTKQRVELKKPTNILRQTEEVQSSIIVLLNVFSLSFNSYIF